MYPVYKRVSQDHETKVKAYVPPELRLWLGCKGQAGSSHGDGEAEAWWGGGCRDTCNSETKEVPPLSHRSLHLH